MVKRDRYIKGTVSGLLFSLVVSPGLFCTGPALGATWSPELQIHYDDNQSDWSPQLAVDSNGTPWVVWMGVDPVQLDEEIFVTHWTGSEWAPRESVHPDNSVNDRFPEIAAGKLDGVPWVVWARWNGYTSKYDFLLSRSIASGWAEPETVFAAGSRYDAYDIAVRDTSLVWIVWSTRTDGGAGDRDVFARKREDGAWGEVEQLVKPDTDDWRPRADLDLSGRLWVVWDGSFQIFSAICSDTGWSEPIFVKYDVGGSVSPSIAIDDSDVPWIVWTAGNAYGGSDLLSARWETGTWVELGMVNAPDDPDDEDKNPVIVSIPGSGPVVVWWGGLPALAACMDVYESKWTASGWRQEGHVSTPDSVFIALDESPSAAVGSGGRTWVCWMRMENVSPYDYDIWARYSDDVTPVYSLWELSAAAHDGFIILSWTANYTCRFRVYRSDAVRDDAVSDVKTVAVDCGNLDAVLPDGTECLTVELVVGSGRVEYEDSSVEAGACYEYWIVEERADECYINGPVCATVAPVTHWLSQSYPNPFNPICTIRYDIAQPGRVSLEIFDIAGRLVRTLVDAHRGPDSYSELWDGRAEDGTKLPSGVYFYRLEAGQFVATRKMVLLR